MTTYKDSLTWKVVSVATAVATIVTLSGVIYLTNVLQAFAANEGSVGDVTGTSPRIAADGESERVFLGLNLLRQDDTKDIQLDALQVTLEALDTSSVSGDEREATLAAIEEVRLYLDSSLSGTNGVFDDADSLVHSVKRSTSATNNGPATGQAGLSTLDATNVTGLATNDYVRIGTGATAEIRKVTNILDPDNLTLGAALSYSHNNDEVRKVSAEVAANAEGFQAFDGTSKTVVELGDFNDGAANIAEEIAKNDTGNDAGHDFFVVLLTKDGIADMEVKAQVTTGDVQYRNVTDSSNITAAVSSETGTTSGKTKAVTYGADGVDPTITSATTKDSDGDGRVDQFVLVFSEQMATGVTASNNFVDALGGTQSRIENGATDLTLEANGEWSTTNVLNDTLTFDVTNQTAYTDNELSTGDSFTVRYDKDITTANQLKDATGELLEDASVTSTDGAEPVLDAADLTNTATLHDLDGDGQVDELRVTASETLDTSASTHSGFKLVNTTANPDKTYTITGVNGFTKNSNANANSNDTIKLAVQESGSTDVSDAFTVSYTKQTSGGAVDLAGNTAPSDSDISDALSTNPVATKVEFKDNDDNGKLDRVEVTFSCTLTTDFTGGDMKTDWVVSGYSIANNTDITSSGKVITIVFTEGSVDDTGKTPDVTYTDDGETTTDKITCGDDNFVLEDIVSGDLTEVDKAGPVLQSATLYEANDDDIWNSGETLQLVYSEAVDASSIATSWNSDGATGNIWEDFAIESADATASADGEIPDSGTVSVSGKVITLTASEDATVALDTGDKISNEPNEVKDAAGNSAFPANDATAYTDDAVALVVDPTTAPAVDKVATADEDGNGVLDALYIYFNGLVDGSTVVAGDWAAARGSNFTITATAAEDASATTKVTPDLTINSVSTLNGGNDTVVVVRFKEASEGTGAHPQVKYVKGSLKDLAGNAVASFNEDSNDSSLFMTGTLDNSSQDEAAPVVVHKLLKDRNTNGKYDQLVVVFSEGIDDDAAAADALTADVSHSATGWSVENHSIAANGTLRTNDGTYDAYTFSGTNAVFEVEIFEDSAPTTLPAVTYTASGNFKDRYHNNVLGSVAAGGEVSEVAAVDVSGIADGDLISVAGDDDIYIVKLVGTKKFKRLILNPDIFNSYGHLSWANVKTVTQDQLDQFTTSDLILEDGTEPVYRVSSTAGADTGTKQWLNMTAADFEACGYDWDSIYIVNALEAADTFYPQGADITGC